VLPDAQKLTSIRILRGKPHFSHHWYLVLGIPIARIRGSEELGVVQEVNKQTAEQL